MEKAYDQVSREKLSKYLENIAKTKLEKKIVAILKEVYFKQQIEIGNRKFKPGRGVNQGGVLSPLLFNFYLEDTLRNNPIFNAAIKADKLIAFADDLLLITDSKVEIVGLLKQIESLGSEGLILN